MTVLQSAAIIGPILAPSVGSCHQYLAQLEVALCVYRGCFCCAGGADLICQGNLAGGGNGSRTAR